MSAKRKDTVTDWTDPDEVPDLTTEEWVKAIDAAPVQRGRPKAAVTKVSTTIRLDPDVLEKFRSEGPGWQSRINEVLRRAAGL